MKYLSHFPKPLLDDFITGRWLPVIGAGMSRNAVVSSDSHMPLWNELGELLANEMSDYPYAGALDAISAYEHEYSRPKLIERLAEILLVEESQPGSVHRAFCSIPFDIVCTTNFDFLLERQYERMPRYCRPVIDEDQLSVNSQDTGLTLLKLHGDLHHPNRLVVTESDYDGFLSNYPLIATYLSNLLITRTAVLVGYSLDDPDFRQIWHVVSERLGKTRRVAYSIFVDARPTDIARFERRGVKIINLPGNRSRYPEILKQTFEELRDYMRENVISVSHVTDEESLRELSLPLDAVTRLCFVAITLDLHPFYRERVFPIVRSAGFVPVTAGDVISPGENFAAKIDSLLQRSAIIVVDASSPATLQELRMVLIRDKEIRVLVITSTNQLPPDLQNVDVIVRPDILKKDPEPFLEKLLGWFSKAAKEYLPRISDEPLRLFEIGENRAAVIAAITLLEGTLRARLAGVDISTDRVYSVRRMVELAKQNEIIAAVTAKRILGWLTVRNKSVHSHTNVTRAKAQDIVHGVMEIVNEFR